MQAVVRPQAGTHSPVDTGPDLDCLDHAFFLEEFTQLQTRVRRAHEYWHAHGYGRGRRAGSRGADAALHLLDRIAARLAGETSFLRTGAPLQAHAGMLCFAPVLTSQATLRAALLV